MSQSTPMTLGVILGNRNFFPDVLINEAQLASASAPVNGVTTTTLANLPYRVPIQGFAVKNLAQYQTSGAAIYNALETSLHQRAGNGSEFLLSYTWARDLTDSYNGTTSTRNVLAGDGVVLVGFPRPLPLP